MTFYQNDKYENFFLNLKVSREGLAKFGDFTSTAVAAPGVAALIGQQGPGLATALADFRADMVARRGQGGGSQSGTSAEETAYQKFKDFLEEADKKVFAGYFYDHPDEHDTYYPDGLSGLTHAPVKERLTRLRAYTEALEASSDAAVLAKGAPARLLLDAYKEVAKLKTKSRTTLKETISELGPAARTLAEALWAVHTAALYVHRQAPQQARRYFDFASLPNRIYKKKKKTDAKAA